MIKVQCSIYETSPSSFKINSQAVISRDTKMWVYKHIKCCSDGQLWVINRKINLQ